MGKALSPKRIAILMAFVTLASFLYKLTIGILSTSMVLIIAAIPTFLVFVCKLAYVKNMHQSREAKKKGYFAMALATTLFVIVFLLFSVFKIGGIDIHNENRFEGWIGILFIAFILLMFILSIVNLKGALDKTDLIVKGIREITFVSALADAVMIVEFLVRMLKPHVEFAYWDYVSNYAPLALGVIMAFVAISMWVRFARYKP
jgi:hypothetical protein